MGDERTGGVNYSRWEIGEQPQRRLGGVAYGYNYSRWEIGEQPQQWMR